MNKKNLLFLVVILTLVVLPALVFSQAPPPPPEPPADPDNIPLGDNLVMLLVGATLYGARRIKMAD
jgi:hypothetical protein